MDFPKSYIFIILLLSIILILSYPYFLKDNAEYLWGPIKGNFRKIYYISIFLVFIGFIPLSYLLLTCKQWSTTEINNIFYSFLVLIIMSWIWIPLSVQYAISKNNSSKNMYRMIIVIVLLLVSLSIVSLYFISKKHFENHPQLYKNTYFKSLLFIGLFYAFFHTFFMDFILWAYLVLFRK